MGYDSHGEILDTVAAWHEAGKAVAVATVVKTWGSSPRPAGSQLAVNQDGAFAGSVSGGCIENAVVKEALAVMEGGAPRTLEYGIANEMAWEVGLACGGRVVVRVAREEADDRTTRALRQAVAEKRAAVVVTRLGDGARALLLPMEDRSADGLDGHPVDGLALDAAERQALVAAARDACTHDRSTIWAGSSATRSATKSATDEGYFLHVCNPALRLVVVGAVHIAQSLVPMARMAGFDVMVVDPRTSFATKERFPGVAISHEWPDDAVRALGLDRRSALVTLTHDPKLDEPALLAALDSPAFYIGALGSTRTQAARLKRLEKRDVPADQLARIHGPVGLDIGARQAPEIAVSIMAQMVERLRRPGTI